MSISDHVGILLDRSLDQARPSKRNPAKVTYYARVALPAAAGPELLELAKSVAPNGSLAGLTMTIKTHSALPADKQLAGIPADALIVRLTSGEGYPPDLFLADGSRIPASPLHAGEINGDFYSGQRVRINTYPFYYPAGKGDAGISWNLSGLLAVGGGERRGNAGGESSESAFARYAAIHDAPPPATAPADAFGAGAAPAAGAAGSDPFQQGTATGAQANPFG